MDEITNLLTTPVEVQMWILFAISFATGYFCIKYYLIKYRETKRLRRNIEELEAEIEDISQYVAGG